MEAAAGAVNWQTLKGPSPSTFIIHTQAQAAGGKQTFIHCTMFRPLSLSRNIYVYKKYINPYMYIYIGIYS